MVKVGDGCAELLWRVLKGCRVLQKDIVEGCRGAGRGGRGLSKVGECCTEGCEPQAGLWTVVPSHSMRCVW